jgi:hypothetical protein
MQQYKILKKSGESLNGKYTYDLNGSWCNVPGDGAYVSERGIGIFYAFIKIKTTDHMLVRVDVSDKVNVSCLPTGVTCWRRVRINTVVDWTSDEAWTLCLLATRNNGHSLSFVPESLQDREICLAAVSNHGLALVNVPDKFIDREMCLAAMRSYWAELDHVPVALRDRDMCLEGLRDNGIALNCVPVELRDREMCLTAVRNNGVALRYVPDALRDREMYLTAVRSNKCAIQYVPVDLQDREIIRLTT